MDATAMSLRQPLRFPPTGCAAAATAASSSSKELRDSSGLVRLRRRRPRHGVLSTGFRDLGHLQYYKSSFDSAAVTAAEETESGGRMSVMSGKEVKSGKEEKSVKKMKKKQLKLVKGLSRDLSTFSQMGFGLDSAGALLDQIKGNMITEATQLLLEQLQKVKAEEKEAKRRMKEEKARVKAASRMQIGGNCETSSSSSSSESSDSECGEVIDMKSLKTGLQQVEEETSSPYPTPIIPTIPPSLQIDADPTPLLASPEEETAVKPSCSSNTEDAGDLGSKKIEVCMGGKCKKSGAGALLEEFQRVVGIEGAVSGCKCMGKCRDGPNVKVVNGPTTAMASLCIKVGLEDVNVIVSSFIDEHQSHNHTGFAVAS
ncbi:diacylglycerol O-acyltransferase 3 [Salvia miltiorrhiza]|uniref:diacylglycerol O-acyltransferase 3 n=1 Tax=Salvia miltiorrhiza TaxID=226208 RepID=UPI0025AD49A9|nr:diacylglycerol O-acyltransferase 3 [Salvia miltiorrhiza]